MSTTAQTGHAWVRSCLPAPLTHREVTLYLITPDNRRALIELAGYDEPLIALGREAADEEADQLMARLDVNTVAIDPVTWGSGDEDRIFSECHCNGMDLHGPTLLLAERHRLDVDPHNFDPVAILLHLRSRLTPC